MVARSGLTKPSRERIVRRVVIADPAAKAQNRMGQSAVNYAAKARRVADAVCVKHLHTQDRRLCQKQAEGKISLSDLLHRGENAHKHVYDIHIQVSPANRRCGDPADLRRPDPAHRQPGRTACADYSQNAAIYYWKAAALIRVPTTRDELEYAGKADVLLADVSPAIFAARRKCSQWLLNAGPMLPALHQARPARSVSSDPTDSKADLDLEPPALFARTDAPGAGHGQGV